ncbi:MAG TPA: AI-2E family transporter, partial [Geobacterales bacterium]|nr:AI-2E family transporter [Geobacterales bacterium]
MNRRRFWVTVTILLVVMLALIFAAPSVFSPIIIALVLAYLLDPLVSMLERRRINRGVAIVTVFVAALLVLSLVMIWFTTSFIHQFAGATLNLPDYALSIYAHIPAAVKEYLGIETPERLQQQGAILLQQAKGIPLAVVKDALALVTHAFTSTLAFLLTLLGYVITPVYLFYFLKDLSTLKQGLFNLVPRRFLPMVSAKVAEIDLVLGTFIRGQLVVCVLLAVLYSIGFFFIGIDLSLPIGTLAGLAFIVPYLGTIIGIVLSLFMAFLKFHDLLHPLLCLGWIVL